IIVLVLVIGIFYFVKNSGVQDNSAENPTKISVALDWLPYAMHSGLYVAKERGYFANEGLEVDIHAPADAATILQTVAQGRDDFGLNYQPDVLLARSEGLPVVSVAALTQHSLAALMTVEESGLKRPRDLKGKRIGHSGVPLESLLYDTILKNDGVGKGIEDVQFINVGYDALTGLLAGQLDAASVYYTNQPVIAENQGRKVNIIKVTDYGVPDYYDLVIVTNEDMIKNNPDVVERFLRAITKGYKEAATNPKDAIQLMVRAVPELDTAVANKEILLEAPIWIADNGIFGWQEESRWLSFAQWMKNGGLLTKPVDARQAFTNSFIESLK
ncbi:MAG: putative hydroxymethylpyrimidine transport system substrate-binding protein, partial [Parcubacteria group bacterium Gr01-1014_29]